ncbi:hypothetical protein J4Q44_G00012190, partial [Coregonus suidteri]
VGQVHGSTACCSRVRKEGNRARRKERRRAKKSCGRCKSTVGERAERRRRGMVTRDLLEASYGSVCP